MRVFPLPGSDDVYSCVSYLVLGDWNRIEDVNTLIDTGSDGSVVHAVERVSTGLGKIPVEQVILTHEHFDYVGGLSALRRHCNPKVYASHSFEGVDQVLKDGQFLRLGDRDFEVLHTPGHSQDSLCLYCRAEKALFSGDTTLQIRGAGGSHSLGFVRSLERIAALEIETIYPGHGEPWTAGVGNLIRNSLSSVHKSTLSLGSESVT